MAQEADLIQELIDELKRLPGIGPKSAQRLVFYLLRRPEDESRKLGDLISRLKSQVLLCSECNHITTIDPCQFCRDPARDRRFICVVEEPFNVLSIEKSGDYRGLYHVLHGAISPIDGIGPEELKIKNLLSRLSNGAEEVIVATNPTIEGEATALYLSKLLKPLQVKISRIALGIPVGSELEYSDSMTISRALSGRQAL